MRYAKPLYCSCGKKLLKANVDHYHIKCTCGKWHDSNENGYSKKNRSGKAAARYYD